MRNKENESMIREGMETCERKGASRRCKENGGQQRDDDAPVTFYDSEQPQNV